MNSDEFAFDVERLDLAMLSSKLSPTLSLRLSLGVLSSDPLGGCWLKNVPWSLLQNDGYDVYPMGFSEPMPSNMPMVFL